MEPITGPELPPAVPLDLVAAAQVTTITTTTTTTTAATTADEEDEKDEPLDDLDVSVDHVEVASPHSNLKKSASKRRLLAVSFSETQPKVEFFEIEEGSNFRKTPSAAKLKAMAGRWSNPFALNSTRKRIRVDEMEDAEEVKANDTPPTPLNPPAPTPVAPSSPSSSSSDAPIPVHDPSAMSDQEIDAKFLEVAIASWNKLVSNAALFKVEQMVPDLKASGLFDTIRARHGAVRKWFALHPEVFGLSVDNFISFVGYNEDFRARVKETLAAAPKQTMKLHQLTTDIKSQVSENGFRKAMRGYDNMTNYISAHSNDFMLSKDKTFVTIRRVPS